MLYDVDCRHAKRFSTSKWFDKRIFGTRPALRSEPHPGSGGLAQRNARQLRCIHPAEVYQATHGHRGYWWMAGTSIVQRALDNRWLRERAVPSIRQQWIELHYGQRNDQSNQ